MGEVLVGIFTGFIASGIFLLFLRNLRPNIEISPQIAYTENNGIRRYTIKLINKNKRNIVDIRTELLLVRSKNVPGGAVLNTQNVALKKDKAFILSSYDKKDVDAKYARRFVTEEDLH